MTNRAVLLREVETLPADCLDEVGDFVARIKHRKTQHEAQEEHFPPATMLLSEVALSKDWNTPEEDEAWAGL